MVDIFQEGGEVVKRGELSKSPRDEVEDGARQVGWVADS